MNQLFRIVFLCGLHVAAGASSIIDCSNVPNFDFDGCCNIIGFTDQKVFNDSVLEASQLNVDENVRLCRTGELALKKLGLIRNNEFDTETAKKKIPAMFDGKWKAIYESVLDQCYSEAKANVAKLQIAAQVTRAQCDLTFISVAFCADLIAFSKCPTENWKNNAACNASQKFIETCGANVETMITLGI